MAELDKALIFLAERLLGNYNGVTVNIHLVVYYTNNLESCPERPLPIIPEYREYHGTPKRTAPPTPHPTTVTISVYSSDEENNLMAPEECPITLGYHPIPSLSPEREAEHLVAEADVNRIPLDIPPATIGTEEGRETSHDIVRSGPHVAERTTGVPLPIH